MTNDVIPCPYCATTNPERSNPPLLTISTLKGGTFVFSGWQCPRCNKRFVLQEKS
jgi:transposase-like protein